MKNQYKKWFSAFGILMFLSVILRVCPVYAEDIFQIGDFEYTLADGRVSVHSYVGQSPSVTLPTSVMIRKNTYEVTATDENSFEDNTILKSVTVPKGYVRLGNSTFKGCVNLSTVVIQADLEDSDIKNTQISEDTAPFYRAGILSGGMTVTFGSSVTRVPAHLFATSETKITKAYAGIKKVVLPESVVSIGEYAFYNCYDMKEISFGEDSSLTEIEKHAFDSTALEAVTLPKKLKILGDNVFRNCTKLESVEVMGTIGDREYPDAFYRAGKDAGGITVTFGAGVSRVPSYLFATDPEDPVDIYPKVKKVVLPDSLTEIGESAFCGCRELEKVNFKEAAALKSTEYRAFAYTALTDITFGPKLSSLGEQSFLQNGSLAKVVLPESLTVLGRSVFKDCVNLGSVTIEGNIEDCDFAGTNNSEITAPFYNAGTGAGSMTVVFGSAVKRIPANLFATSESKSSNIYPPIRKITLPAAVTEVGHYAFYNCYDLAAATVRNANVDFGEKVFYNADQLVVTCQAGGTTEKYMIDNNIPVNYIKPKKTSISGITKGSGYITVKWKRSEGALRYILYRKTGSGKWVKLKETSGRSFRDKKVANGKIYRYKVYAAAGKKKSAASEAVKTVYLTPPRGLSAENSKPEAAVVTWVRNSKAAGYQVRYVTGKTAKTVAVKGKTSVKKTLKSLKKGAAYSIRVRAYMVSSGKKYYSAYSRPVSLKIRK